MHITAPEIDIYCANHSNKSSDILIELANFTQANVALPHMMIGPLEGAFLATLIASLKARRVLEIGCFTGYSALCMAQSLPADGLLVTLDISASNVEIAKSFWQKSPDGAKIKAIVGPALESLSTLSGTFDFIFIDADKRNYQNYFDRCLELLSAQGMIAVDNCLWDGEVLNPSDSKDTLAICAFNEYIAAREDLSKCLVPIRDGVFIISKK